MYIMHEISIISWNLGSKPDKLHNLQVFRVFQCMQIIGTLHLNVMSVQTLTTTQKVNPSRWDGMF